MQYDGSAVSSVDVNAHSFFALIMVSELFLFFPRELQSIFRIIFEPYGGMYACSFALLHAL